MGYAKRFAKQLGLDSEEIISNMASGDYENLLEVFDENFGSFVILERWVKRKNLKLMMK